MFAQDDQGAEALIRRIVAQNMGRPVPAETPAKGAPASPAFPASPVSAAHPEHQVRAPCRAGRWRASRFEGRYGPSENS